MTRRTIWFVAVVVDEREHFVRIGAGSTHALLVPDLFDATTFDTEGDASRWAILHLEDFHLDHRTCH